MAKIGVLGAGTWGMALARMLCNSGHEVTVWSALEKEVEDFSARRRHPNLPGMIIPDEIEFTKEIGEAVTGKDVILFAVPSVFVRGTAAKAAPYIPDGQVIVDVAKGIEPDTLMTLTEVIADELNKDGAHGNVRLVALSGPTHAEEVAKDIPTAIVSASTDQEAAVYIQQVFTSSFMRVYTNDDVKGIELCGALKNIIALAAGMVSGMGYGDNTKAALITRGMAEMSRLGSALGAQPATFAGLAGIGDMIVTCTSVHSRNNRAGYLMGQGLSADEAVKEVGMVVEGINAIPAALALAKKTGIELPIIEGVDMVVNKGADPKSVLQKLMERQPRPE